MNLLPSHLLELKSLPKQHKSSEYRAFASLTSSAMKNPSRSRGDRGLGLPSSGRPRNSSTHDYEPSRLQVRFRDYLGRGCEADVW